jgi:two-component system, OmpR family, sensor histidine kinase KdpD
VTSERRPQRRFWLLWFSLLFTAAALLLLVRSRLDKAHIALVFLLVVLGGSAAGGRLLGMALAAVAFLIFDVGFLPPYSTLTVADPLDWLILFAFLVTGVVGAQLLERQRREAELANARAAEIDRLATLGAETLNAPRPDDALRAIADVIRQLMETDRCEILLGTAENDQERAAEVDVMGAMSLPARVVRIPLTIRRVRVGTLALSSDRPFLLLRDKWRVLGALSYYAALGVERLRLAAAEEEAESLRRADRVKDALLASVSHDLRTPLTTIKGIANEIARGGDSTRAYVIEEEADRLSALVNDLLDLSQLTAGEMPVESAVNTADDVIGAAVQRVESVFPEWRIRTELGTDWTQLVGRFDFRHTMRILANLLENAAKYAPPKSPVTLRAWRQGDALLFAVEDEGEGIPEAECARLFEPFARGTHVSKEVRGRGLGLSIARRLAEVQGGSLVYEPRAAVRSRFVLRLPAADVELE